MSDRGFLFMLISIDVAVWLACFIPLLVATEIPGLFCATFSFLAVSVANMVVSIINLSRI